MRFKIITLVDITKTDARRHDEKKLVNQQANFNTLYNTIGLRTNPTEFNVTTIDDDVNLYNFGKKYKGNHKIWVVEFFVEADESTNVELLECDFDLVPIITGLDETINFDKEMFITSQKSNLLNIVFSRIDK